MCSIVNMPSTAKRSSAFRPAVLAQGNNTCRASLLCRLKGPRPANELEADHIKRFGDGHPDDPSNGQVLCKKHHQRKTTREARKRTAAWKLVLQAGAGVAMVGAAGTAVLGAWTYISGGDVAAWWATVQTWWLLGLTGWLLAFLLAGPVRWWWQQGDDSATPQVSKSASPDVDPAARLQAALRPMFGKEETYRVTAAGASLVLSYADTQLADEDEETWVKIADKAAAKLGGRWRVEPDTQNDRATLTRRPGLPKMVPHPGFPLGAARPWYVLPVGIDEHGKEWAFNLKHTAHLLIAGTTGKGKTSMIRTINAALIDSASRGEVEIVMCDPKLFELMHYRIEPLVAAVHTSDEDMYDAILEHHAEMERRKKFIEAHPHPVTGRPVWPTDWKARILILEELRELYGRLDRVAVERGEKITAAKPCEARQALQSVAQLGRALDVRLIELTQRPDAKWLGGDFRELIEGRAMVGPSPDGAISAMLFGSRMHGRDVPASALGRTTIQVGDGQPVEIQSYYTE